MLLVLLQQNKAVYLPRIMYLANLFTKTYTSNKNLVGSPKGCAQRHLFYKVVVDPTTKIMEYI